MIGMLAQRKHNSGGNRVKTGASAEKTERIKKVLDKTDGIERIILFLGNEVETCPLLARRVYCRGTLAFFSYAKSGHVSALFTSAKIYGGVCQTTWQI